MTTKEEPSSMRNIMGNHKELEERLARIMASPERVVAQEKASQFSEKLKEKLEQNTKPLPSPVFAEMATDLCRTTMFFPDNPHLKVNDHLVKVDVQTQWGTMSYRGYRLNTLHEDVLLALTTLLRQSGNRYVYSGPFLRLLKLLGKPRPSIKDYKSVFRMLDDLKMAKFDLITRDKDCEGSSGVINDVYFNKKAGELYVEMNNIFVNRFMNDDYYSLIELKDRLAIKGSVAKALFRFVRSQSRGWTGPWKHLAIALNMMDKDTSDPARHAEIRRQLKKAITTLVNAGKLEKASGFEGDRIRLVVVPLKTRKQLGEH